MIHTRHQLSRERTNDMSLWKSEFWDTSCKIDNGICRRIQGDLWPRYVRT